MAYAAWISKRTGKHYRLPTESEWLYAAHAQQSKPRYPERFLGQFTRQINKCELGNAADLTLKAVYPRTVGVNCSDSYVHTAPVGRFKNNPFGLHDMLGNVSEWMSVCTRKGKCTRKAVRGGSWLTRIDTSPLAYKHRSSLRERFSVVGFRVAKTPTTNRK